MSLERTAEWKLAATIRDVVRQLARSVPAPRGAPYFGLDISEEFDLHAFDVLRTRGIFRKYELALDLGAAGLGGRARWLATCLGCRVVGLESRPAMVAAAIQLNRRAHLDDQVSFRVGELQHLPLRDRIFTHVWMLELPVAACTESHLAEAFRVLRRGGHFALQCPAPSRSERAALVERLSSAGFFELEWQEIAVEDMPHSWRLAEARLRSALEAHPELLTARAHAVSASPLPPRLQLFGRRPA